MRTVQIPVYPFAELSPKAKDRVKNSYMSSEGYVWHQEAMKSLEALAQHFGGKLADYEIDWFECSYSRARFEMPELEREEIAARLRQLAKDCPLTGYCTDMDAIHGFREAFNEDRESDINSLMQAAFKQWLRVGQADCRAFYEDENFAEHCDANEWEFFADGSAYLGDK